MISFRWQSRLVWKLFHLARKDQVFPGMSKEFKLYRELLDPENYPKVFNLQKVIQFSIIMVRYQLLLHRCDDMDIGMKLETFSLTNIVRLWTRFP